MRWTRFAFSVAWRVWISRRAKGRGRLAFLDVAAAVSCLSLPGCGSSRSDTSLHLPVLGGIVPDPVRTYNTEIWPESLVYNGLYKFDTGLNVVPDLAVGLPSISLNATTYSFTIRSDARFDDGRPVTSGDVAYSFWRAVSRREDSRPGWETLRDIVGAHQAREDRAPTLSGIRILGMRSLQITLTRPDPRFLLDLALPAASILERSVASRGGDWWWRGGSAAPFRIEQLGDRAVLRANSHYDDGKPALRSIVLQSAPSMVAADKLYLEHRLDAAPIPPSDFGRAAGRADFTSADSTRAYYLIVSARLELSIRVALAEAIDRSSLSAQLDPLGSVVPNSVVQAYPAIVTPFSYQPTSARRRLRGLRLTFVSEAGRGSGDEQSWLSGSLRAAGAVVTSASHPRFPDLRLVAVQEALPYPQSWLRKVGDMAFVSPNPTFRRLLRDADAVAISQGLGPEWTADNQAESMLLDRALVIPVGVRKQGYLVSAKVQGLIATPLGLQPASENWATVTDG